MSLHDKRFPGESDDYRNAREKLLQAEIALEEQVTKVAEMRAALPPGGEITQSYVFQTLKDGQVRDIAMADLFAPGKPTLLLYSFMFGRKQENPCPACTSLVDGFNGIAAHLLDRLNVAVCASAPIADLIALSEARNWNGGLRLISSSENSYNSDYFAETPDGSQIPALNVFTKDGDGIVRHFYGAEKLYVNTPGHPRHVDRIWPIWNVLDLTPEGRDGWFPRLAY